MTAATRRRLAPTATLAAALVAVSMLTAPAGRAEAPVDDPLYLSGDSWAGQWNLWGSEPSPGAGVSGIDAEGAWQLTMGREDVVIANVDTGVDLTHEDIAPSLWVNPGEVPGNGVDDDGNGYVDDVHGADVFDGDGDPTDTNGHGTATAGIAAARGDNGIGIAGVCPRCSLMAIRVGDSILDRGEDVARGIRYAADHGASVVSMSLGGLGEPAAVREAVAYARARGVVLVEAMGNEFQEHANTPVVIDGVLGVAALEPVGTPPTGVTGWLQKTNYSDYGPHLFLSAPSRVPNTRRGGGYGVGGGTSSATPHVAGAAGLVVSRARDLGMTLSSHEVAQILRAAADDITGTGWGASPGWDRFTGYGRVNAAHAVEMVAAGGPPSADVRAPSRYQALMPGRVAIEGVASARAGATTVEVSVGRGDEPAEWTTLRTRKGKRAWEGTLAVWDAREANGGLWTIRLVVTDAAGRVGEDRQPVVVVRDPQLAPGWPVDLGGSAEGAPVTADLDGDGALEIVVATASGAVHALRGDGRPMDGWPVALDPEADGIPPSVVSSPAAGDLDRDGRPEVVAGATDGKVYVFARDGSRLAGWPRATAGRVVGSPVLADLDGDGALEVIAGSTDQHVYAWRADGSPFPGWPALARDLSTGSTAGEAVVGTPAVGDLDGDGSQEVVVGSTEVYPLGQGFRGRVYAWRADGSLLPGWPVAPVSLIGELLPIVGRGVPSSPALSDVTGDGRPEVIIGAVLGPLRAWSWDGTEARSFVGSPFGAGSDSAEGGGLYLFGSPSAGTFGGETSVLSWEVGASVLSANGQPSSTQVPDQLLAAWSGETGAVLDAFPRRIDGWMTFFNPAIADVSGDGIAEALAGTSRGTLDAFETDGSQPPAWPKDLRQWLAATPAVADLDGDGRVEVIATTRLGGVFVWRTPGLAEANDGWWTFHHDEWHTGLAGADTRPPAVPGSLRIRRAGRDLIRLDWVAPGDDGHAGTAAAYDVRASRARFDSAADWDAGVPLGPVAAPAPAGAQESLTVSLEGGEWWVGVRALDDAGNGSWIGAVLVHG